MKISAKNGNSGDKYGTPMKKSPNCETKKRRLRVATFITCIGKEALEVHNGLPFQSDEEKTEINKVLELWANHCIGKTNIIYERYKFNNRSQEQTETIDTSLHSERSPKLVSLEP